MEKVAGTCGCFDMFHDGHISILQERNRVSYME